MINLELLFKEKPNIPDWFKDHPIFKETTQITKIFPNIGLKNFQTETDLKYDDIGSTIKALCYDMVAELRNAHYCFVPSNNADKPAIYLLDQFMAEMNRPNKLVKEFLVKKGLYLTSNINTVENTIFSKKGESLFKSYNKLKNFLHKHYNRDLSALDKIESFKDYSNCNIDGKLQIVFSSDGIDGAWDILTMSQRGISSCQSWNGQYKECIIGSLLDPYTGIMYLTSGSKTQFGSKMIRRCVVRFIVNSKNKRPSLFLEYMYPSHNVSIMKEFKKVLAIKTNNKFPIIDEHSPANKYYVPYNKTTGLLLKHSKNPSYANWEGYHNQYTMLPYRDTYMEYKIKDGKDSLNSIIDSEKSVFLTGICNKINKAIPISKQYNSLIRETIDTEVFSKIKTNLLNNKDQYLRDACVLYFANKNRIFKTISSSIKQKMSLDKDKSILIPGVNFENQTN